jgi:hypothetical protein
MSIYSKQDNYSVTKFMQEKKERRGPLVNARASWILG